VWPKFLCFIIFHLRHYIALVGLVLDVLFRFCEGQI
jgi:hypothetical protein